MDDDLIGMAFGYTRPATSLKVWPDGKIRACVVDYMNLVGTSGFSETRLKTLRSSERADFDADKDNFFGPVADKVLICTGGIGLEDGDRALVIKFLTLTM